MNATQLKDILEHSVSSASATGAFNGKFAQVSGMKVTYDTSKAARPDTSATDPVPVGQGQRIRRVVLDDGTVLIDGGDVVNPTHTFSFTTIDFTANGGDRYPFPANGVVFENDPYTITYQEALANFIQAPKANGVLHRVSAADGDEITVNMYGEENAFDLHGRLIDVNAGVAVPGQVKNGTAGRDTIVGTAGDDIINGGLGADVLTGGAGGDKFVYGSLRDAGDTITDFTPYADTIQLGGLLAGLGCASGSGCDAVADGYVRVVDVTGGASLQIDPDGAAGSGIARTLVTLKGLTAKQVVPGRDLGL